MFKLVQYEERVVDKRAVGILLECLLVLGYIHVTTCRYEIFF